MINGVPLWLWEPPNMKHEWNYQLGRKKICRNSLGYADFHQLSWDIEYVVHTTIVEHITPSFGSQTTGNTSFRISYPSQTSIISQENIFFLSDCRTGARSSSHGIFRVMDLTSTIISWFLNWDGWKDLVHRFTVYTEMIWNDDVVLFLIFFERPRIVFYYSLMILRSDIPLFHWGLYLHLQLKCDNMGFNLLRKIWVTASWNIRHNHQWV